MNIKSKVLEEIKIFYLDGSIKSAEDLELFSDSIDSAISAGRMKILLNFEGVDFINSSGLGRLVMADKKIGEISGSLKITNLREELEDLFNFTKLKEMLAVYESEEEAIKDF